MLCGSCFKELNNETICPHCGYDALADAGKYPNALKCGSILNGRYITGRVHDYNGSVLTYIAQDYRTKERIAIKEYLPEGLAARSNNGVSVEVCTKERGESFAYGREYFLDEAKKLAEFIGNEHIVRILSYFDENRTSYFAMEYVEGKTLDVYMREKGRRLTPEEANSILLPLMDALQLIHSKGVVHRDIAPDNIIITKNGIAKLIDFSTARYSIWEKTIKPDNGLDIIFKHGFAPKEQYSRRGKEGPYTDVYSFAATYYYAITGKVPPEALDRIDEDDIILPSTFGVKISPKAEDALMKALSVEATDRFQSMSDFKAALEEPINICISCGNEFLPGDKFCRQCGAKNRAAFGINDNSGKLSVWNRIKKECISKFTTKEMQVYDAIEEPLNKMNIELLRVHYGYFDAQKSLIITIDSERGVNIDMYITVCNVVRPVLSELKLLDDDYSLVVGNDLGLYPPCNVD